MQMVQALQPTHTNKWYIYPSPLLQKIRENCLPKMEKKMWNPFSWTQNSLKLMWSVQILLKKAQRNISRFSERISLVGEHNPFQTFIHTLFIPQNIEAQEKGHPVKKNQIFLKQRSNENNRPNEVHNGAFQCNTPHYVKNMQFWILASKTWRRFSLFGITMAPPKTVPLLWSPWGTEKGTNPPPFVPMGLVLPCKGAKATWTHKSLPFWYTWNLHLHKPIFEIGSDGKKSNRNFPFACVPKAAHKEASNHCAVCAIPTAGTVRGGMVPEKTSKAQGQMKHIFGHQHC